MTQVDISKGITLDVDFDRIMAHPAVVEAAVRFAVKQALTNTHAGVAKDEEGAVAKSRALAEKRLETMYAGSWGSVERGTRVDPVEREMRNMAEADMVKALKSKGKKQSDFDKEVWKKMVAKQVAFREDAYRKAAEEKLAIKPEEAEIDLDALLADDDESDDDDDQSGDDTGSDDDESGSDE